MCRGNQGPSIFSDDQDRRRSFDLLRERQARIGYPLFAYVLMSNHVHHLIQTDRTPLSMAMQNVTGGTGTSGTKRPGIYFRT
jgi:putative transposase